MRTAGKAAAGFSLRPDDATVAGSKRDDGRFGFVAIELDVALETSPERIEAAERAAEAGRGALPRQAWRSSPCTSPSPLAAKAIT